MPGNSFGTLFKVTTWGESHGDALGMVLDGCPPGMVLDEQDIQKELNARKPKSKSSISTQRMEQDNVQILSGVFNGKTTGTPISMIVYNKDARSKDYSSLKSVYRPGHADFTYQMKYGFRDYRGGGRASGRETVCRVIAGAIAKKILNKYATKVIAHTIQIGGIKAQHFDASAIAKNEIKCADSNAAKEMVAFIKRIAKEKDSVGGIVEIIVQNPLKGLGEPVFDKLDADLAKALMSIGAVKGVSFGKGFAAAEMRGSEHNDELIRSKHGITSKTNYAGGILGGISSGTNIVIHIAIKPTPSIGTEQNTVSINGKKKKISIQGRHDTCIIPRLIPVAESMVAITLVDHILRHKAISHS